MNKRLFKVFSLITILALMLAALPVQSAGAVPRSFANPSTTVFINEIHYDNDGTDAGESIEVAGPAGTDLTGWSIVLYNGSTGLVYDTDALNGILVDQQGGYGTTVIAYATNGIQNGSPDGIALLNGTTLVQFLSYEGAFTALDGPAVGQLSTDIGVSQASTAPLGSSLQLTGSGENYGDFTWTVTTAHTFGSPNTGQSFGAGDVAPTVTGTTPADGVGDVAVDANITINFSESVNASEGWYDITCTASFGHTAVASAGPSSSFTLDPDADFAEGETCTVTVFAAQITDQDSDDPPDAMESDYTFSFTTFSPPPPSPMIINELDSDTPGTDAAEFVELYDGGLGNTDLTGLVLVFYNGNGDVSYAAFDLDGRSTNASGYFVLGNSSVTPDLTFGNGALQNGEDAVALYQGNATDFPNGTLVTTTNLIDAIVYDTSDADDPGLLVLLNSGQPQVNEDILNGANHSNQRCPNGSGGQRNTDTYIQNLPTPGATNNCGVSLTIMQIQDSAHRSPYAGQLATDVSGVVTAVRNNGFNIQDASGDGNIATSDGLFVFTDSLPSVAVGDSVLVRGFVSEFRPGGSSGPNLTTTEITGPFLSVAVQSSGNALPAPTVIGVGGRVPPTAVIDDDPTASVEDPASTFDVTTDGIDFYESMEGMLIQVNDPVVVGPTNNFGEIFVLTDNGTGAGVRTSRDGIIIQQGDFNPERIQLDDTLILPGTPMADANVGDHFTGPAVGVLDYNFGNFEVLITSPMTVVSGGLAREVTGDPTDHQLSVASFNVENLGGTETQAKFDTLAGLIVNNLKSPDVIGLEEIQDNNGTTNNGVVDADVTLARLIDAIVDAGGPEYEFRQINPVDGEDGGAPGGNIRVGFLFNPARVQFVDRPGADSTTAVGVVNGSSGPELSFSPGRIDPTNIAFDDSRKPLAGEFLFQGDQVFVVVNHFNSKGGDDPLFGRFQPPTLFSEAQRLLQAQVVNDFVDSILALDSNANIIVLGDLNDFQFSNPLNVLKGGVLVDLVDSLPLAERYTYVFEGNSQALDHILASNRLANVPFTYDVVHVNSEFHDQASDHEPEVALMCVDRTAPSLTITVSPDLLWPPNHKYVNVNATVSVSDNADPGAIVSLVSVTSNEPDNAPGPEDGNTTNDIVIVDDDTFRLRAERSDTGTGRVYTITYQATDACGNSITGTATVTVPLIY